jgi:formate dehydrogenase major subunit
VARGSGLGVFDEMRKTMPSIAGITWERLEREHAVTYPCTKEGDPGQSVVFVESFPREGGKARFVPADIIPADERPDASTRWCSSPAASSSTGTPAA